MSNVWKKMYTVDCGIYEEFIKYEDVDDSVWKRIIELIDFKNKSVFEMGCGTGKYSEKLAPVIQKLFANDISSPMLTRAMEKCCKYQNVEYILNSAERSNLPDRSVDIVFSAWGYVAGDADFARKIDAEFNRILKPKGEIWLIDNYYDGEFYNLMKKKNSNFRYAEEPFGYELVDVISTRYQFPTVEKAAYILGYILGEPAKQYILNNKKLEIENKVAIMRKGWSNV